MQRYGPVVRIAPNRVMFNDAAAVREIYGTHDFRKGEWLAALGYGGTQNSLCTPWVRLNTSVFHFH